MNRIHPHSLGLVMGTFLATMHVIWSILVFFGGAQWLINVIFKLHMMSPIVMVTQFNLTKAVLLIIVTGCIGYIAGRLLGTIWNRYAVK